MLTCTSKFSFFCIVDREFSMNCGLFSFCSLWLVLFVLNHHAPNFANKLHRLAFPNKITIDALIRVIGCQINCQCQSNKTKKILEFTVDKICMEKKVLLENYHRRLLAEVKNCELLTNMNKETIVSSRPDREIRKTVIKPGDYTMVPYEDSRCKIRLCNVKCENKAGPCEIEPECRILNSPFDGNVIIGDMDSFIDKDFELVLQQMCLGEICDARFIYRNVFGDLVKEISCRVELVDLTEEQLISDWSWARLFESAVHHKERGVQLVKDKRIVDGFRRFSKALKMLVAIEPVDRLTVDEERIKELVNMRVKLFNNMAHCQLQFEEYGATLDLCSRALKLDPDNIKSLYRRSIAYVGLFMYEEAWGDIQRALEIDPTDKASIAKAKELRPHIERINNDYANVIKKMFG